MNNDNQSKSNIKLSAIVKSLFLPKEMVNLTRLPGILAVVILLLSSLFCVFSSRLSSEIFAKKTLDIPSLIYQIPDDFTLYDKDNNEFPLVEFAREDLNGIIHTTKNGVYQNVYEDDDKSINVTFVIHDDLEQVVSLNDITDFDYQGYLHQVQNDNKQYVLYIMTKDTTYYSYNLKTYDTNEEKYYLPLDESELVVNEYGMFDVTKWTKEVEKDAKIDFYITNKDFTNIADSIVPTIKYSDKIDELFYGQSFPNLIIINYGMPLGASIEKFTTFHSKLFNTFIQAYKARFNVLNFLMALVIVLVFPPILSLITWLISKQFNLKRYKDYYFICSICFFDTSILALFVGFFVQYSSYAFIYLTITSIFYIISIIIINNDQIKFNPKVPRLNKKQTIENNQIVEKKDYTEIG